MNQIPDILDHKIILNEPKLQEFLTACLILESDYLTFLLGQKDKSGFFSHQTCLENLRVSPWFQEKKTQFFPNHEEKKRYAEFITLENNTLVKWQEIIPQWNWQEFWKLLSQQENPRTGIKSFIAPLHTAEERSRKSFSFPWNEIKKVQKNQELSLPLIDLLGTKLSSDRFQLINARFIPMLLFDDLKNEKKINAYLGNDPLLLQHFRWLTWSFSDQEEKITLILIEYGGREQIQITHFLENRKKNKNDTVTKAEDLIHILQQLHYLPLATKMVHKRLYLTNFVPKSELTPFWMPFVLVILAMDWKVDLKKKLDYCLQFIYHRTATNKLGEYLISMIRFFM